MLYNILNIQQMALFLLVNFIFFIFNKYFFGFTKSLTMKVIFFDTKMSKY